MTLSGSQANATMNGLISESYLLKVELITTPRLSRYPHIASSKNLNEMGIALTARGRMTTMSHLRRHGRVAEGGGLLNRCRG
jgi:hypothetical protein